MALAKGHYIGSRNYIYKGLPFNNLAAWTKSFRLHLIFFPAIMDADLPAFELAVAWTFTFSALGFLVSLLLFLPLAIVCPFKMPRSYAEAAKGGCNMHRSPVKGARRIIKSAYVV
jgi:hypothetical protein